MNEQKVGKAVVSLLSVINGEFKGQIKGHKECMSGEQRLVYDTLMNKQQLAEKLGCHISKVNEFYVYQSGFPSITPPGGKEMRFSHFAVDKWIVENMDYN